MIIRKLLKCIIQADNDYHLFEDNDKVCVGISGGKDSIALLYCLNTYQKVLKNMKNINVEFIGVHIDMNFGGMDFTPLDNFFKENGITLIHEKTNIYDILKINKKNDKIQCSLCSTLKKGAINKKAKELGCNKVAYGHHIDDAIETLFMNMISGGRINTFEPKMYLNNSDITFVRPFIYAHESMIKELMKQYNIPVVKSTCPNDGYTNRQDIKELLEDLYTKYPEARGNFKKMLSNTEQIKLFKKID